MFVWNLVLDVVTEVSSLSSGEGSMFTAPTVHSALACSHPLTVLCSALCIGMLPPSHSSV